MFLRRGNGRPRWGWPLVCSRERLYFEYGEYCRIRPREYGDIYMVSPDRQREIGAALTGPADEVLERLAERLGGTGSATVVYGAPIERDDVTVIPVAKVRWGFGVRGMVRKSGVEEGTRGGGGVVASPAGYIEIREGHAEFRPLKEPVSFWAIPLIILAGGMNAWLLLRGVRGLLRR